MIQEAREHNETVAPNYFQVERLRSALPEYFAADGSFMLDRFQNALRDQEVEISQEGFELEFLGKSYAKYQASTASESVLAPDLTHNSKLENRDSQNLYLVGDNIEVLKHLLGSYAGKVDCIYIDPPYNTGSDGFVYNDDFGFSTSDLASKVGLSEVEAERVMDLRGKSSHSAWLTFMYPRLQLAKELLAPNGVIFISIDDNEQANLKLLCDEIFGEQNFIGELIRLTNPKGRSQDMYVANNHEYLLVYSRIPLPKGAVSINKTQSEIKKDYKLFDAELGAYRELELRNTHREFGKHNRPNLYYPIFANSEGAVSLSKSEEFCQEVLPLWPDGFEGCWTWGKETAQKNIDLLSAREVRGSWKIYRKSFAHDQGEAVKKQVKSLWTESEMRTEEGQNDFDRLFDSKEKLFQAPKPVSLLERAIKMSTNESSLVLDFFSGSGSTAHAVMNVNAEDEGKRRYIMVQLPERIPSETPASKAGYETIDELGRDRIERAAAVIQTQTKANIDYGFQLYRTFEPTEATIEELETFDPSAQEGLFTVDYVSKFDHLGTPGQSSILSTWLVKDGYGLTAKPSQVKLDAYSLDVCGDSAYIIQTGLTSADVVELIRQIENNELDLARVVVFAYSVSFSVMHELKKNLSVLKSGKTVAVIERF